MLKSDPDELAQWVGKLTDPWIAPTNDWLVEHLPTSKRRDSNWRRQQRNEKGKKWSEEHAAEGKSYADTVAKDESPSNSEGEGREKRENKHRDQLDMELFKTLTILQGVVDAQLQRAGDVRGYVAEIFLPGYVPIIGGWLGDKAGGRRMEKKTGDEEKGGQKFEEQGQGEQGEQGEQQGQQVEQQVEQQGGQGDREREKMMGEGKGGDGVVEVEGEERRVDEGLTVAGGREF